MPVRIQRRRTKGWRMPEGAVYVGRPTKWGSQFYIGGSLTRERAVAMYRRWLGRADWLDLEELRGKDLACWCRLDQECHADVLLELANQPPPAAGLETGE